MTKQMQHTLRQKATRINPATPSGNPAKLNQHKTHQIILQTQSPAYLLKELTQVKALNDHTGRNSFNGACKIHSIQYTKSDSFILTHSPEHKFKTNITRALFYITELTEPAKFINKTSI